MKISGIPIYYDEADGKIWYTSEFTIDADGAPNAYGPEPPHGTDWLGNAGYQGNWWGIVTDSNGDPFEQNSGNTQKWPFPGYYVSTTAYIHGEYDKYDCRRYVDSNKIAYSVIPGNVRNSIPPKFLGCAGRVTDLKNKKAISNVPCCDIGPSNHCGEGSIWLANQFGLNPSPKTGGSSDRKRFLWEFWPGMASASHPLQ